MPSSYFSIGHFKSSLRVALASVFASREKLRDRFEELRRRFQRLEVQNQRVINENREFKRRLHKTQGELGRVSEQLNQQSQAFRLPTDPCLKNHSFGPRMIALCCSLCQIVGFRSTERVLPLIGQWLDVELEIPSRWTLRHWSSRNGVAILKAAQVAADDWIWLVDHSVQLGTMSVLIVLGIRQSELPEGRALRREDMSPLAVIPGHSRSKESVAESLQQLAEKVGGPLSIVIDGASELEQGTKQLENVGFEVLMISDVKHKAANSLKKTLGKEERFAQFEAELGKTTASLQQTELAHFLPPKKKTKCRFMNLGKLIDWAQMVMHHLKNPSAAGNQDIAPERLQEKLGWLLEFQVDIQRWHQSRQVVSTTLQFTNVDGLYVGATDELKKRLADLQVSCPIAQQVADQLTNVLANDEQKLNRSRGASLRLLNSTEVLESSLGSFKALQRHHSRGTFTSLLAVFPTLFRTTGADSIGQRLSQVSTKDLSQWLKQAGLTNSTQARKTAAYRECKQNRKKYALT